MKLFTTSLLMLMTLLLPKAHGGVIPLEYQDASKLIEENESLGYTRQPPPDGTASGVSSHEKRAAGQVDSFEASKLDKRLLIHTSCPPPNATASRSIPHEKRDIGGCSVIVPPPPPPPVVNC